MDAAPVEFRRTIDLSGRFPLKRDNALVIPTPVRYERDDARRRVVVTVQEEFQASAMISIIERQRADDAWTYGMLYDLRRMTGHPSLADLREMMEQAASRRLSEAPRGPVAILVTDPAIYSAACSYAALGRSRLTIQMFRDFDDADRWLTRETKLAGN